MPKGPQASPQFLAAVRDIVGPSHCITDPDLKSSYELDWTRRFGSPASVVVRPADVGEVAQVLAACSCFDVPVVPQGGNTGLVGGSVPRAGEAVLSLTRLAGVISCDRSQGLLVARAGTTLAQAQQVASKVGAGLGIDLAARDTATLGGMVATNAGGVQVVRHGSMRARLRGIEVVLADGTIATRLKGLVKDNVGYDLGQVIAGSEGTLGVVTTVALDLVPTPPFSCTVLVGLSAGDISPVGSPDAIRAATKTAVALATSVREYVEGIEALEIVYAQGMALVRRAMRLGAPPDPGAAAWLLVEASANSDPLNSLAQAIENFPGTSEVAVADSPGARQRLWAYRELHTEAIATLGVPHKLDVTLPMAQIADFAADVPAQVCRATGSQGKEVKVILFGHLGDGNIHVNVIGPGPEDQRAEDAVAHMVLERGGSISAEHGVGVAKLKYVTSARSPGDVEFMRRLKAGLDPEGILNPGVLLPPPV